MSRWPGFVYSEGEEPDYRFSFANERTFLAWIRTALALLAAGVALDIVELSVGSTVQHTMAVLLIVLGLVCAVLGWVRWALAERSMRRGQPLPSFGFAAIITLGMAVISLAAILTFVGS